MKKNKLFYIFLSLSAILVLFDQLTKVWVKGINLFGFQHEGMSLGESISLIGDKLLITYVENAGMAFGIEFGPAKIFLSLFSFFASLVLIYYIYKLDKFSNYIKIGVSFILAGAFGNMIDRIFYGVFYGESALFFGRVVDFIQVDIPDIDLFGLYYTHWPVFNFADSYVSIGVVFLLIFNKHIPTLKQLMDKEVDETETGE